ncbi:MAG: hypothetical protein ACREXT_14375 [Gammaproteobacteria bacterium]
MSDVFISRGRWLDIRCALVWMMSFAPLNAAIAHELMREEYRCLSDILGNGLGADAKYAVIADRTIGDTRAVVGDELSVARASELNVKLELLRECARVNAESRPLGRDFKLNVPYTLLTESARDLLFRGDNPVTGWKLFFARFPDSPGLLRVSRVAFDAARTQALAYVELQCGPDCGAGRLIQARAENDAWRVEFGELIWIAGPET